MSRFLLSGFLLMAFAIAGCNKEQNTAKPAYDDFPEVISDSLMFSYRFNTGYQTGDTIFPLLLVDDTLQVILNISEYKSGWLEIILYSQNNEILSFPRFMHEIDTTLIVPVPVPYHHIRLITEKFTANYQIKLTGIY